MSDLRARIDRAASRDRGRLLRLYRDLHRRGDDAARERLEAALSTSIAQVERRAAAVPPVRIDESLPIAAQAQRLTQLIQTSPVVVVAGETGSGKTTQLPKLCLAAGRGTQGLIGCTQPRRIAARSVARRVAQELGGELGDIVGFQVRFSEQVSERSLVKFMTDGILLAEIQSDRWLSRYDTIIVDEAHERSLNIDFLLGYLKGLVQRRPDLRVIVTSATIDTARFAAHFGDAPVVEVPGRSYPVEIRYRPVEDLDDADGRSNEGGERGLLAAIAQAADEITREDPLGDVLVFLPGEREIRDAHQWLARRNYRETEVLPLYARLSARDQDRVFSPGTKRRIVLATNVAETSLTVPRIRYVIDPGVARVKRYSPRQKIDRLHIEPISQASADQRAGRCGRVAAGVCYRLYSEHDFGLRARYTDPELQRSALAGVILRMLALRLGDIADFPFIDPPQPRAISDGWQELAELAAVDERRQLTVTGRAMSALPVDVKLARMLVEAQRRGCLREVEVIAAFLAIQDPRERPADARDAADRAHAAFADAKSEFVGILNLWRAYSEQHEALTQGRLRDWCREHFLSFLRMREWRELHRQIKLIGEQQGWTANAEAADYATLHATLLAGLPTQVGHRNQKGEYEAPRQRRFKLFPASPLTRTPPPWTMAAVLLDTRQLWGLTAARIEPQWVMDAAPHLLSRRHFDAHWSRKRGRAAAYEQISLFGLVLAPKQPVDYGRIDPIGARALMIAEGLVRGEIDLKSRFLERNLATLALAQEEQAKRRTAALVADEAWQIDFYEARIPADVHTARDLDRWVRGLDGAGRAALEWSLADLLPRDPDRGALFPDWLPLGDTRLRLRYRFEPGTDDDGVNLIVPLHLLNALDAARLSWLVPGLLEDKATALIRALPKALRRNFVPAPDFARAFVESAGAHARTETVTAALAAFLERATGVRVAEGEWDETALEPHLRMRIVVVEDEREIDASRDLDALRRRHGARAERAFAAEAARGLARRGLREFPPTAIEASVPGDAGVPAFPALVDRGEHVDLVVFANRDEARRAHAAGVERLLRIALSPDLRRTAKQLPVSPRTGLQYAAIESAERLREDLADAALASLLGDGLTDVRDPAAFAKMLEHIRGGLFPAAVQRLELAEAIMTELAALAPWMQPPLMGYATANYADLARQRSDLVAPGFLRGTPENRLADLPRYLRAMRIRAERLRQDAARDQARMLELAPFVAALDAARERGLAGAAQWRALRWQLEEFRVSLFAQELGTREPVSAKRLARTQRALEEVAAVSAGA